MVSMVNDSPASISCPILSNMSLPANTATPSGLNGDSPRAISSALTNYLIRKLLGNMVIDAVVFPAPLHPAMM